MALLFEWYTCKGRNSLIIVSVTDLKAANECKILAMQICPPEVGTRQSMKMFDLQNIAKWL